MVAYLLTIKLSPFNKKTFLVPIYKINRERGGIDRDVNVHKVSCWIRLLRAQLYLIWKMEFDTVVGSIHLTCVF